MIERPSRTTEHPRGSEQAADGADQGSVVHPIIRSSRSGAAHELPLILPPATSDEALAAEAARHRAAAPWPADPTPATEPVAASVAEVGAEILARMRATARAHERHLESIELEAARRCELLTAQAELDAELIRLHARRDAHAIVAAAQTRTDPRAGAHPTGATSSTSTRSLRDIGEAFSRLASDVDEAINPRSAFRDRPRDL